MSEDARELAWHLFAGQTYELEAIGKGKQRATREEYAR